MYRSNGLNGDIFEVHQRWNIFAKRSMVSRSKVGVWLLGVLDTGMFGVGGVDGSMSVIISFIIFSCCRSPLMLDASARSCTTGGGGGGGRLVI